MAFEYRKKTGRYHDKATGKIIARKQVLADIDATVARTKVRLRAQVRLLNMGKIPLEEYQDRTAKILKDAHLQAAMVGAGGKQNMNPRRFGFVGSVLNQEYRRMNVMAEAIANEQISVKQAFARIDQYGENIRATFYWNEQETVKETGVILARRLLTPGVKHCDECILYERRDWTDIGLIVPIATACSCRGRCRCVIQFKRP